MLKIIHSIQHKKYTHHTSRIKKHTEKLVSKYLHIFCIICFLPFILNWFDFVVVFNY